jgi:hypothetical protein
VSKLSTLALCLFLAGIAFPQEGPRGDFELALGPGITYLYNHQLIFALSGAEIQFGYRWPFMDLGGNPMALTLRQRSKVFPLGISLDLLTGLSILFESPGNSPWEGEAGFYLSPGLALFRPFPLFGLGIGLNGGLSFRFSSSWALGLYGTIEYETNPTYSDRVSPYHHLGTQLGIRLSFRP